MEEKEACLLLFMLEELHMSKARLLDISHKIAEENPVMPLLHRCSSQGLSGNVEPSVRGRRDRRLLPAQYAQVSR